MFSCEICKILKNSYFEEHLWTTAFSSSYFKLDLVDLTVFSDSNLRLAKINKSLTTWCVSKLLPLRHHSFCHYAYSPLFFHSSQWIDVKSNRCFSGNSLISIILLEYYENNIKTFWCYSYENKWIISWKTVRLIFERLRLFKAFQPIRLYFFS